MTAQTVLLLDDDADDRSTLRGLLEGAGFHVVDVPDGRRALNYLTSETADPSLIVTDLAMPDMSGWEFINILQAYVRLSLIPLFVVSGVDAQKHRIRLGSVTEYFRKPIDPKQLVEAAKRRARPSAAETPGSTVRSTLQGQN